MRQCLDTLTGKNSRILSHLLVSRKKEGESARRCTRKLLDAGRLSIDLRDLTTCVDLNFWIDLQKSDKKLLFSTGRFRRSTYVTVFKTSSRLDLSLSLSMDANPLFIRQTTLRICTKRRQIRIIPQQERSLACLTPTCNIISGSSASFSID
jgi:hypothetical protein